MERLGVTAREVDITASMRNLKEFLRLRDTEEVFIPRKEQGWWEFRVLSMVESIFLK